MKIQKWIPLNQIAKTDLDKVKEMRTIESHIPFTLYAFLEDDIIDGRLKDQGLITFYIDVIECLIEVEIKEHTFFINEYIDGVGWVAHPDKDSAISNITNPISYVRTIQYWTNGNPPVVVNGKEFELELKLYGKYKHINNPDKEFIYIGNDNDSDYWFLYKNENSIISFSSLKDYGFNPSQIIKDLNLEIIIDGSGNKYIKEYKYIFYSKQQIEINLKPLLKDKLKNIINR
jgi:hypothetical protein